MLFSLCVLFISTYTYFHLHDIYTTAIEYGRKYASLCVQDNADVDRSLRDLSAGIIWHDIGKWTEA